MAPTTRTGRPPSRAGRTSTTTGTGRFARAGGATRTQGLRRRRQPQPTGFKKILSAVVPSGAAKKATPSSKTGKAGGFALVAAAAGMAFKNRDKLSQMRHKDAGTVGTTPPTTPTSSTGANDAFPPPSTPSL